MLSAPWFDADQWKTLCMLYELSPDRPPLPLGEGLVSKGTSFKVLDIWGHSRVIRFCTELSLLKYTLTELAVLVYVSTHYDLQIPRPCETIYGDLVALLESPVPSFAVVFSFLEGVAPTTFKEDDLYRIGVTLGNLDNALLEADIAVTPTPSINRVHWNEESLIKWPLEQLGKSEIVQESLTASGITLQEICVMSQRLRSGFVKLDPVLRKQLIHSDVHSGNLLFNKEQIAVLDFDELGYGPRVYELAALITDIWAKTKFQRFSDLATLIDALVEGYRQVRQLTEFEVKGIPLICAIRIFGELGWASSRSDLPWTESLIKQSADRLRAISSILSMYAI